MVRWFVSFRINSKNYFDFLRYGQQLNCLNFWSIAIDAIIFFYALWSCFDWFQEKSLLLLLFLIFANLIWQIVGLFKNIYSYLRKTEYYNMQENLLASQISMDASCTCYDLRLDSDRGDSIVINSEINAVLQRTVPIRVQYTSSKSKRVEHYLLNYKEVLLPFINLKWHQMQRESGGSFYNETKLCLASEIKLVGSQYLVQVCRGSYYNSFLTNFIYNKQLSHQTGFDLLPPRNSANYLIPSLDRSVMGDHIGVSTLAISTDGCVLILRQNNKAVTSPDCLTPSGSGSVDYKDADEKTDLREIIIAAAQREFEEESLISSSVIRESVVIGFYRDLNRGGKPEFCCLTYLNIPATELVDISPSWEEQRDDYEIYHIFDADNRLNGRDFEALYRIIHSNSHHERVSLALYATFELMCRYVKIA